MGTKSLHQRGDRELRGKGERSRTRPSSEGSHRSLLCFSEADRMRACAQLGGSLSCRTQHAGCVRC